MPDPQPDDLIELELLAAALAEVGRAVRDAVRSGEVGGVGHDGHHDDHRVVRTEGGDDVFGVDARAETALVTAFEALGDRWPGTAVVEGHDEPARRRRARRPVALHRRPGRRHPGPAGRQAQRVGAARRRPRGRDPRGPRGRRRRRDPHPPGRGRAGRPRRGRWARPMPSTTTSPVPVGRRCRSSSCPAAVTWPGGSSPSCAWPPARTRRSGSGPTATSPASRSTTTWPRAPAATSSASPPATTPPCSTPGRCWCPATSPPTPTTWRRSWSPAPPGPIVEALPPGPLDVPLDCTTPVAWAGYADAEVAARLRPAPGSLPDAPA